MTSPPRAWGNTIRIVFLVYVALLTAYILAPVFSLVLFSFQAGQIQSFPIEGYSLRWYRMAIENSSYREGFVNSVVVGVAASSLAVLLGFSTAHTLSRLRWGSQLPFLIAVSIPAAVPAISVSVAILICFQQVHLAGGLLAVIVAHVCIVSPFAAIILLNAYKHLNPDLESAAHNLGAGFWTVIGSVVIPQLRLSLIGAWVLCFVISWDEYVYAWYLGGFSRTLPVVIYGRMSGAIDPSLNAIGTLSIAVSIAFGMLFWVMWRSRALRER
jgi:spermidine/putrescine transport system permease protein